MTYDSTQDTLDHIAQVQGYMEEMISDLRRRSEAHDQSKLRDPEKAAFDEFSPRLRETTYGSEEYKTFLTAMEGALDHHYRENPHHPEHWETGIHDMSLLDVLEMLADWKAASLRHPDGDLSRSITQNAERFGYGPELEGLLRTTARRMGWL